MTPSSVRASHSIRLRGRTAFRISQPPGQSSVARIGGFDGVRGIAAFCVLIQHSLYNKAHLGEVSVYVFFVLSGFLIFDILYAARLRVESRASSCVGEIRSFLRNRGIRILPVYFIALVAVCLMGLFSRSLYHDVIDHVSWYVFYLQNFFMAFISNDFGSFGHTWSLAVEQQFYFIFGILFIFVPARRWPVVLSLCLLISTIAALGLQWSSAIFSSTLPFAGFSMIVAGGGARIYGRTYIAKLNISPGAADITSLLCVCVVVAISVIPWGEQLNIWSPLFPVNTIIAQTVVTVAACLFLLVLYHCQDTRTVRILSLRPFVFMGAISYSFYVFHYPVRGIVDYLFSPLSPFQGMAYFRFAAIFVVTFLFSIMSLILIERPAASLKLVRPSP